MKKNYMTPNVIVYSFDKKEIFTAQSGEFELISFDDWFE